MKKRSTKEIKQQAKVALQGHYGIVILGLLAAAEPGEEGSVQATERNHH